VDFDRTALIELVRWLAEIDAAAWLKELEQEKRQDDDAPAEPEAECRAR